MVETNKTKLAKLFFSIECHLLCLISTPRLYPAYHTAAEILMTEQGYERTDRITDVRTEGSIYQFTTHLCNFAVTLYLNGLFNKSIVQGQNKYL